MRQKVNHVYLTLRGKFSDLEKGECYHRGQFVDKDLSMAHCYYRDAAASGSPIVYERLAELFTDMGKPIWARLTMGMKYESSNEWTQAVTVYQALANENNGEALFRLGLLYEADRFATGTKVLSKDLNRSFDYYRQAIPLERGPSRALDRMVKLSTDNAEAAHFFAMMYERGEVIGMSPLRFEHAMELLFTSAMKGNRQALTALESRIGDNLDHRYRLAGIYEYVNLYDSALRHYVTLYLRNHHDSIEYIKREARKNKNNTVKIACLFAEAGAKKQAALYYFDACKANSQRALTRIIDFVNQLSPTAQGELAALWEANEQCEQAVLLYRQLKNTLRVDALVLTHSACAYVVAREFENENDLDQAYQLYIDAALKKHEAALKFVKEQLHPLAKKGDTRAQYYYGCIYCHQLNLQREAADWAILAAEAGYKLAIEYLNGTKFEPSIYVHIGTKYKKGEGCQPNTARAYEFYCKAVDCKDLDAIFIMGEECIRLKKYDTAYSYFIRAHQLQASTAIVRIEQLAELGNKQAQYFLGCQHLSLPTLASIRWALLASEQNEEQALYYLQTQIKSAELLSDIAHRYAEGIEVKINPALAIQFYKKAIEQKHVPSMYSLAVFYIAQDNINSAVIYLHMAIANENAEALTQLESLASQGHPVAQFTLATEIYLPRNESEKAIALILSVANKDFKPAQFYLHDRSFSSTVNRQIARAYANGDGVKRNIQEAIYFYTKNVNRKDLISMFELGLVYLDDKQMDKAINTLVLAMAQGHEPAIQTLKKLADDGNAMAQFNLAVVYYHPQNNLQYALTYIIKAFKQGYEPAIEHLTKTNIIPTTCLHLGNMYRDGNGVAIDISVAKFFYQKACDQNNAQAMYQLALLYAAEKNQQEQINLLLKAGSLKHKEAISALEDCARNGSERAYYALIQMHDRGCVPEAIRWAVRAAELGYVHAVAYLEKTEFCPQLYVFIATFYMQGIEAKICIDTAISFLYKGIELNDGESALQLAKIYFDNNELDDTHQQAYLYLARSAQWRNEEGLELLKKLAREGDEVAQYYLATEYYHHVPARFEAINWAIKAAEKGYQPAINYLQHTLFEAEHFAHIAKKYEDGDDCTLNLETAVLFYSKAIRLKHKESAYALASLYYAEGDLENAYHNFKQAAQLGLADALVSLNSLGEELDTQHQLEIGHLFASFDKQPEAVYWYQKAAQGGSQEALNFM